MNISILTLGSWFKAQELMRDIGVDAGGIKIMSPKTELCITRINRLAIFAANILKQESLSLGADTAVSRAALSGKARYTDCLIIGNLSQYALLCKKLKMQPYGLKAVASELSEAISHYQREEFLLALGRYKLNLNSHTHIMGIVNVTSDSFSGDGLLARAAYSLRPTAIADSAQGLVDDGADIIDIGGESSRPGARPVSLKEELVRVIPAIKAMRRKINAPISVDTYKSEVARQALDNGADMINDITALSGDHKMAKVIAGYRAAVVLMHMRGSPRNMQKNPRYKNCMEEIISYLRKAIDCALEAGIDFEKIIVDPGIGFGKGVWHNLEIIRSLSQLKILGRPILIGTSRKSFIGKITASSVSGRLPGTISSNCLALINGARILRVHDVKETKQALLVLDSIMKCR
jgi:dihydropteroate synthase